MSALPITRRALRLLEFFGPCTAPQIAGVIERDINWTTSMLHDLASCKGGAAVTQIGRGLVRTRFGRRWAPLWSITNTGRAVLTQGRQAPIQAGGLPHLTLSRASGEPQSAGELYESVCQRYDLDPTPERIGVIVNKLRACGLLERRSRTRVREEWQETARGRNRIYTYVLTPAGEDMLTRLPRPA